MDTVLELENVSVHFDTPDGTVQAVRDVSLSLKSGETLAIVGESGCGKSVLCKSVMKLLPGNARISGKMLIDGKDITPYTEKQMRKLRGSLFSMLFQDPMTTLNPTIPIGKQITEAVLKHRKMSREDAQKLAVEMLHRVGIDDPAQRMLLQPHYFSGGMRQRCVLAIALALNPHILFADEPTTALDVTVQAQMLDLLRDIQRKTGIGIVLVSHDLGVVARIADRVAVMYAGKIVEIGTAEEIFYDPRHPYTWGLLGALPSQAVENGELRGIPGMPPTLLDPPPGDAFAERNQYAMKIDYERMPPMFPVSETHSAATWLLDERAPAVTPPSPSNAAVWSIEESGSFIRQKLQAAFPHQQVPDGARRQRDFFRLAKGGNLRAGRGIRLRQVDGGARHYGHLYPDGRRDLLQRLSDLGKALLPGAQERYPAQYAGHLPGLCGGPESSHEGCRHHCGALGYQSCLSR